MASSEFEYASSAPFGCVLRDNGIPDWYRENGNRANFPKNLKHLVTGRLHSCIGITSGSVWHENPGAQNDNIVESWIGNGERNSNHSPNDGKKSSIMNPKLMQRCIELNGCLWGIWLNFYKFNKQSPAR